MEKSVLTMHGATAFTWMLNGASSMARTLVIISIPALAIPYIPMAGAEFLAAIEEMLTIFPVLFFRMIFAGLLRASERSGKVGVDNLLPKRWVGIHNRCGNIHSHIVDQSIQPAKSRHCLLKQVVDVFNISDVRWDGKKTVGSRLKRFFCCIEPDFFAAADCHPGILCQQQSCDFKTDSPASAGYEKNFVVEIV